MTAKRRGGPVRIDPRDQARIDAMAGVTRRLMETTNMFVEAAASFSAATTEAGKVVPMAGTAGGRFPSSNRMSLKGREMADYIVVKVADALAGARETACEELVRRCKKLERRFEAVSTIELFVAVWLLFWGGMFLLMFLLGQENARRGVEVVYRAVFRVLPEDLVLPFFFLGLILPGLLPFLLMLLVGVTRAGLRLNPAQPATDFQVRYLRELVRRPGAVEAMEIAGVTLPADLRDIPRTRALRLIEALRSLPAAGQGSGEAAEKKRRAVAGAVRTAH